MIIKLSNIFAEIQPACEINIFPHFERKKSFICIFEYKKKKLPILFL